MPPDVNCTMKVLPQEMFIERFVSRVESVKLRSQLLTTTCCATVSVVTKYGLERVGVCKKNLDRMDQGNEWNVTPTGERQVVMSGHGREAVAYDMWFNFHLKVTYFLSDAAQRVLHKFIQKLLKCV